jgi:hypothetical protein
MGGGFYSTTRSVVRKTTSGDYTKSSAQLFSNDTLDLELNPKGLAYREARDSEEHPNSLPIIIGLDVTGSMGYIPNDLVKDGLNKIMGNIIQNGIPDPQVLFLGIGDHECDRAPLQVSQFESSDELCDAWLQKVWLEGRGGGNGAESYLLAWYAARYTKTDQFDKRGKKGYLFTIGDEPNLQSLPAKAQEELMGNGEYEDITADELLTEASKMYEVYHIHVGETYSGGRQFVKDGWQQKLGDRCVIVEDSKDIPTTIARIIAEGELDGKEVVITDNVADIKDTSVEAKAEAVDTDDLFVK